MPDLQPISSVLSPSSLQFAVSLDLCDDDNDDDDDKHDDDDDDDDDGC